MDHVYDPQFVDVSHSEEINSNGSQTVSGVIRVLYVPCADAEWIHNILNQSKVIQ